MFAQAHKRSEGDGLDREGDVQMMTWSALVVLGVLLMSSAALGLPEIDGYPGMLPDGRPFIATMYYERFYDYPAEDDLLDRDIADVADRGWTVAFTDYIHLSLGPVWDRYYQQAGKNHLYVLPNQWNAAFHAGGDFFSRVTLPVTETGEGPTGFCIGCNLRYNDSTFSRVMVEYQSQVLDRYIKDPAYTRIMGRDGKLHPVMIVIYETGMTDYDGHWIDYSEGSKEAWRRYQKDTLGEVKWQEPPKSTDTGQLDALISWNDFRAEDLSTGWSRVSRGLKQRYPDLYTMVIFRQHGLLEGSKSGVDAGGIGHRAIRPELWDSFDIIGSEHDGDDGIEYVLAEADLIKSAAGGRMGALDYYLDSGYKAYTARPVEFHRPWGQSEMLGVVALRGLLAMHYGYNERDDRAGIAATGRRERGAELWQKAACEEAKEANFEFQKVASYVYAASPAPRKAAIVMPYEAYSVCANDELPLDKKLVALHQIFQKADVPVDWVFSSAKKLEDYKLLIVPQARYSPRFQGLLEQAKAGGMKIVTVPFPAQPEDGLAQVRKAVQSLCGQLRTSEFAPTADVESGTLEGIDYTVTVVVNHGAKPVSYDVDNATVFPAHWLKGRQLSVPAHRSAYLIRRK